MLKWVVWLDEPMSSLEHAAGFYFRLTN